MGVPVEVVGVPVKGEGRIPGGSEVDWEGGEEVVFAS